MKTILEVLSCTLYHLEHSMSVHRRLKIYATRKSADTNQEQHFKNQKKQPSFLQYALCATRKENVKIALLFKSCGGIWIDVICHNVHPRYLHTKVLILARQLL